MVIAVLCPGPSLRGFLAQPSPADGYIGVNHAAENFACHYWAANDSEAICAFRPMARPGSGREAHPPVLLTSRQSYQRAESALQQRGHGLVLLHETLATSCPSDREWRRFSLTAALVLAEHLGAVAIRLYGCDQSGSGYFKPGLGPAAHCANRWPAEKAVYSRVLGWLREKKVQVERCFID